MGIHYEWLNERQEIMLFYLEAPWTWDEYEILGPQMAEEITRRGIPIANIVDVSKMGYLPPGNVLFHLQKAGKTMPDNLFASAIVGAPYGATVFMDILMRLQPQHKQRMFFVKTMDEALERIEQRRIQRFSGGKSSV